MVLSGFTGFDLSLGYLMRLLLIANSLINPLDSIEARMRRPPIRRLEINELPP